MDLTSEELNNLQQYDYSDEYMLGIDPAVIEQLRAFDLEQANHSSMGLSEIPRVTKIFAIIHAIIALVGLIGNALVLYIYALSSSSNTF